MSEPKLISPMLDGFDMGGPISDHDGVRCCPAMRKNSDDKYIVKIISVPASENKFDALLLTGAYPNRSSALAYFEEVANGIVAEKKILDNLAQLEGFVPFEDCQIVPMDNAGGYDVYLLSEYRRTLERQISRAPLTQLAAVNLGLDLCTGLAVCRRSGYMCVDLKPSNIYVIGDKEYRIGDLGFARLNYLKYESLPDKYRSVYTAPELEDAFATLNSTIDIYAVGLILYQVFNGGMLPLTVTSEKFEPPAYADPEMAEIILKACDPNPEKRWQDPVQMGQALVNYMQKNGVNDTPLTAQDIAPEADFTDTPAMAPAGVSPEPENSDIPADASAETITAEVSADVQAANLEASESPMLQSDNTGTPLAEDDSDAVNCDAHNAEEPAADTISNVECESEGDAPEAKAVDDLPLTGEKPEDKDNSTSAEEEYDNLSFLDDWEAESAQILTDLGNNYDGITDEVSEMLGQVDALAAHQVPEPVIAPEPVEIKIPDPLPVDETTQYGESTADLSGEVEAAIAAISEDRDPTDEEEIPEEDRPYTPKKKHTGLIWSIVLLLILALGVGGYFFYTCYYLQPIHTLDVSGSEDSLKVYLTADIDETMLTIICADPHGNKVSAPVVDGTAIFSGLTPDTAYTVSVEVTGFHALTGMTSKVYSTPIQTRVSQLSAITGSESGSVILSFTVEGPDSEQWNVIYHTEGEAERVTAFPSHMVTLTGLTVGQEYTFRVEPVEDIYISGETEATYLVRNLVCAENLRVTACIDGALTAQWDTPEGEAVSEWSVRCYNENGYDKTIVTADNIVTFQDVDDSVENIVEVTASGMSVNQRTAVSANSVTVSDFTVDTSRADVLFLRWQANRDIPAEGWTIRYTVNGVNAPAVVTTNENGAKIPVVPNGSYVFTILDETGNAVLGGPFTHEQTDAAAFSAYDVAQRDLTARLCKTPADADWDYRDLQDEDYGNTFNTGDNISVVIALSENAERSDDEILITFAVYDEDNTLVGFSHMNQSWNSMWYQNYCELDLHSIPTEAGTYEVVVYFNGALAVSQKFEIKS